MTTLTGGSVNAMIPSAALQITQGTPKRHTVTADSGRTLHRFFCGDCGSPLFSRRELRRPRNFPDSPMRPRSGEFRFISVG